MDNGLFISATNDLGFEPIYIQSTNPKSPDYYLGIMTIVGYLYPVTYKCLIIKKELYNSMDKTQLTNLLTEYKK